MTNVAASVRARLGNHARATGIPLAALMERFALGRLMWRLSRSASAEHFILKGAQLFSLWTGATHRPTRDVDLLGSGDHSPEHLERIFTALLADPSDPEDGLIWEALTVASIRENQRYEGVRVSIRAKLAGAVVPVQVDIGFGDVITPAPVEVEWKELLDFPEARLLAYPPETVIAEKLEAATLLGMVNSRMKDFFDLDWLCRHREFDQAVLGEAIRNTFTRRGTALPETLPIALTPQFSSDRNKVTQWAAFLKKNALAADELGTIVGRLACFLEPVLRAQSGEARWIPGFGWQPTKDARRQTKASSVESLATSASTEKLSGSDTERDLGERVTLGRKVDINAILAKVPKTEQEPEDRIGR